jgi:hypothetical protein
VKNPYPYVVIIASAFLFAACASEPTLGDKMLGQSESTRQIGIDWNRGHAMITDGEKIKKRGNEMVEEGKKQIEDGKELQKQGKKLINNGEDKINEGDRLISRGKEMIEDSETSFRAKFPNLPLR